MKTTSQLAAPQTALTDTEIIDWMEAHPSIYFDHVDHIDTKIPAYWRVRFGWKNRRNVFPSLRAAVNAYVASPETF